MLLASALMLVGYVNLNLKICTSLLYLGAHGLVVKVQLPQGGFNLKSLGSLSTNRYLSYMSLSMIINLGVIMLTFPIGIRFGWVIPSKQSTNSFLSFKLISLKIGPRVRVSLPSTPHSYRVGVDNIYFQCNIKEVASHLDEDHLILVHMGSLENNDNQ